MAEDDPGAEDLAGLGDSDIEQNVYEGGFKSWEGAMDLALLVMDREERTDHVVEVCPIRCCLFCLSLADER